MSIQTTDVLAIDPNEMTFAQAKPIVMKFSSNTLDVDTVNEARALNGWKALLAYAERSYGDDTDHEPVEQGIRDLLGHLQHLCNELNLNYAFLACRAEAVFKDELLYPIG